MPSTAPPAPATGARTAATSEAPPSSLERDPWCDNAKMLLVTLVVVGHTWVLLPESFARHWAYDFLYLWHMPAFVVVTGYLSRSFTWTKRNLGRLVTVVAVPYVVFEAAMAAFRTHVGGSDLERLFVDPHWPMWFLAALFLWRLATPVLASLPVPLGVATVLSLLGGLITTDALDLSRVTGLLPFFVLGLVATREHVELLRRRTVRRVAAGLLTAWWALASLVDGRFRTEWFYWRTGYDAMDVSFAEGVLVRSGLLVAAAILALSALALVPVRPGWFARMGTASMVVYLFHGFFVRGAGYAGVFDWAGTAAWTGLVVASIAAVLLALLLAAPPVARRLNVLVDPVGAVRRSEPWDLTDWPTLEDRPSAIVAPESTRPRHPLGERPGPMSLGHLR